MADKKTLFKISVITGVLALAGGVFSMAYAQQPTTNDPASNVTALVVAIGTLLGAVAAIATSVIGIIKANTGDKFISDKAATEVTAVANSLKETDYWIHENQQKITSLASAIASISPDAKQHLEDNGMNIQAMTADLNQISEELKRVHAMLPAKKETS